MAFGRTRTNMQAAIEDECSALKSMLYEFKDYFARNINFIRVKKVTVIKDEDDEVAATLSNEFDYMENVYLEYEQEFLKMMVSRVYSYAEKFLGQLIKTDPDTARKKHSNKSDIEAYFITICNEHNITSDIIDMWPDFHEFREMRKNITHTKGKNTFNLSYMYLESNINQISAMLLKFEDYLR